MKPRAKDGHCLCLVPARALLHETSHPTEGYAIVRRGYVPVLTSFILNAHNDPTLQMGNTNGALSSIDVLPTCATTVGSSDYSCTYILLKL